MNTEDMKYEINDEMDRWKYLMNMGIINEHGKMKVTNESRGNGNIRYIIDYVLDIFIELK